MWEFFVLDQNGKEKLNIEEENRVTFIPWYFSILFYRADDNYSIKIIDKQTNQQIKLIGPDEFKSVVDEEFMSMLLGKFKSLAPKSKKVDFYLKLNGEEIHFDVKNVR